MLDSICNELVASLSILETKGPKKVAKLATITSNICGLAFFPRNKQAQVQCTMHVRLRSAWGLVAPSQKYNLIVSIMDAN